MKKQLLSVSLGVLVFCAHAQQDNTDCRDKVLPFFTTLDGFYLTGNCKHSEFAAYEFTIDRGAQSIRKEGVYREVWFQKKENNTRKVSGLQVLQNHVNAIKAVGGEVVKESDGSVFRTTHNGKELWIYVNANTYSDDLDNYGIFSIEVDVMKQEITAQDIQGQMASQGKIALYGIQFDFGKSDIKPESEKAIGAVATYLKDNASVNVYIVGHTDNVGSYESNQKLSKSRGEAVKNYLITRHQIAASRLAGDGVGPICPITSNDTEVGRALNRRVEVVKR